MRSHGYVKRWRRKTRRVKSYRSQCPRRLNQGFSPHWDYNGETGTFLNMLHDRLLFLRIYGGVLFHLRCENTMCICISLLYRYRWASYTIICHSCDYLYAFLRYLWSSSPWLRSKPWVQYSNLYSECELKAGVKRDPEGFGF